MVVSVSDLDFGIIGYEGISKNIPPPPTLKVQIVIPFPSIVLKILEPASC